MITKRLKTTVKFKNKKNVRQKLFRLEPQEIQFQWLFILIYSVG